ncbi:hypothetical protein R50072_10680 [Simiduia litorea]|uniref:BufA1 family periplasmic bufferin-type metallophore n=1 Tax=Simiduia litorea TaxID=1435348 RepID=UPI0036F2BFE7
MKTTLASTCATLVAIGLAHSANAVPDQPSAWEKCAGIAKAGNNDCAALDGKHGCAAMASDDASLNEWVYVPQGSCEKIVGGVVVAVKPAK